LLTAAIEELSAEVIELVAVDADGRSRVGIEGRVPLVKKVLPAIKM
jgi:hypothetical protein